MILEKLLVLDYYIKKLSMSLRNSYGVREQFDIFVSILNSINTTLDELFEQLDVNSNVEKLDDVLDKMATFYGLCRRLVVDYYDESEAQQVHAELDLNNEDLLMLIKATIIKNNWNGSLQQLNDMYKQFDLPIFVLTNMNEFGNAIYYIKKDMASENVVHLFKAGFLSVQSMGISYRHLESDDARIAKWDSTDNSRKWDEGWWS